MKLLLEHGSDVNGRDDRGQTALMVAAGMSDPDMVRLLLSKGADVNLKDNDGFTAWSGSEMIGGSKEPNYILTHRYMTACGHARRIHYSFENPHALGAADPDTTMAIFRRVRDEIRLKDKGDVVVSIVLNVNFDDSHPQVGQRRARPISPSWALVCTPRCMTAVALRADPLGDVPRDVEEVPGLMR